jgi:signal transduction histidine kinase
VQPEQGSDEIKLLRRCINDLVGMLALSAVWSGGDPSQIAQTLIDALFGMLNLDFVYVKLIVGDALVETARVVQSHAAQSPQEVGDALGRWLEDNGQVSAARVSNFVVDGDMTIVPLRLGLQGEIGLIVAGSQRADFPVQTERLILSVASNQAAIGLHELQLLNEQQRIANELDGRIEQRTRELAAANQELKQEIAERRLAEDALGKARSELAYVSRVTTLGALTASIAHEVNQPLSGIITNAGTCLRMLASDPPNIDGARETARRTIRDGNRASDVITRLRALFARKAAATEWVDLNEAAREVIALSRDELNGAVVVLRPELADDLPPVLGDRVQLQQVVLNLLLNASDAMSGIEDRPRQLVVRTERDDDDCVRLSVQDSGVGLEPGGADKLFEAFYTTKSHGMGIGLAVSRSIIESHRGRLWAVPNEGHGATFAFSIPCGTG